MHLRKMNGEHPSRSELLPAPHTSVELDIGGTLRGCCCDCNAGIVITCSEGTDTMLQRSHPQVARDCF